LDISSQVGKTKKENHSSNYPNCAFDLWFKKGTRLMMDHQEQLKKRKEDHIRIVLEREVTGKMTTGLEAYRFVPLALPEIDFASISLGTSFSPSGKKMKTPFLINSMTGGTLHGERINRNLAIPSPSLAMVQRVDCD